jgi:2-polyprenyl-6-hydroxyphenyl methylase/3-demethylubiquinone-9 3-methyltransferase
MSRFFPTSPVRLSKQHIRDFYTQEYVNRYHQKDTGRLATILRQVEFSATHRVVDFACGNGLLLDLIQGRVKSYVGVDFSEEFITQAKQRHSQTKGKFTFYCEDIRSFCQRFSESFDYAFALDFSEHIYDDTFLELFHSMRKTLRPGGQLIIHTPNRDFLLEILKAHNIILAQQPEHIGVRTASELKQLLLQCGYKRITIQYLPHYHPLLRQLHPLTSLPWLGKYFQARLLITAKV